ncbi:MAG: 5-formyltetrahydrofolate cyclo-ligase [Gammaproteobacteria bacterium]|nr:5-formyltetrahydrofolate cyclo-ligase [Gammaproteobacteria bacterium]
MLRKQLREKRGQLDMAARRLASRQAAKLLAASALFQASSHIACYVACRDEFNTLPIIQLIWQSGKKCYLPVISKDHEKQLDFFAYAENDSFILNQYGIPEPDTAKKIQFPGDQLDLVLVPLIGFDLRCHRLGTGGGYYDRSFAFLLTQPKPETPCLVGLGYEFQEINEVPVDSWDVPLDGVLTERKFFLI